MISFGWHTRIRVQFILGCFLLIFIGFATEVPAAEVTGLSVRNLTHGGWGAVTNLRDDYTDTNGWIFPDIHPNGQNQYLSNITGSHSSQDFDSRFVAVAVSEASFNSVAQIKVDFGFEVNVSIDAAPEAYTFLLEREATAS